MEDESGDEDVVELPQGVVVLGEIIRKAIVDRREDPSQYDMVLQHLRATVQRPIDLDVLVKWLRSLTHCVSSLHQDVAELVGIILDLDVFVMAGSTLEYLSELLTSIVSAHSTYGLMCMQYLVKQFSKDKDQPQGDELEQKMDVQLSVEIVRNYAVQSLVNILRVAPSQLEILQLIIRKSVPHKKKAQLKQENYFKGIYVLGGQIPEVLEVAVRTAIKHIVTLDTDVRDDDLQQDSIGGDDEDEDTFIFEDEMDGLEANDNVDGAVGEKLDETVDEEPPEPEEEEVDTPRGKLDALLYLTMSHIQDILTSPNIDQESYFALLLDEFGTTILPTYQTQNAQYLIFFASSFDDRYPSMFVDMILEKTMSDLQPSLIRQAAAAYTASFLARGKFVSPGIVQDAVEQLCGWLHMYIRRHCEGPVTVARHLIFHAICQAVFYILCFRTAAYCTTPEGESFLRGLNLEGIVGSRLNPLKHCQPGVVREFSAVMKMHQLLYCDSLIRQNEGLSVTAHRVPVEGHVPERLEDFFPFDPCTLKRSKRVVTDLYISWDGNTEEDDGDDHDSSDDEDSVSNMTPERRHFLGISVSPSPRTTMHIPKRRKQGRVDKGSGSGSFR